MIDIEPMPMTTRPERWAMSRPRRPAVPARRRLFYGEIFGQHLVFVRERDALERTLIWRALNEVETWGEFRKRLGPLFRRYVRPVLKDRWQRIEEDLRSFAEGDGISLEEAAGEYYSELDWLGIEPPDELQFDRNVLVEDGAFPSWPITDMLRWVPEAIQRLGSHAVGFDYDGLEIPISAEREALAAFGAAGYVCAKNQYLVEIACNVVSGRLPIQLVE